MKIGLLVRYREEEIEFLVRHGFQSLQLLVWPGDPLDPKTTGRRELLAARDRLAEEGLEVSAIGSYGNNLDPDGRKARAHLRHLERLMDLCELFGTDTLCTFAGRDPEKSIPDNIPAFKRAFQPLAKKAEDRGLRIAFENCPMFHYHPFRGVNIAYTPAAWDLMFEAVPSPALGLEKGPSWRAFFAFTSTLPARVWMREERLPVHGSRDAAWWREHARRFGGEEYRGIEAGSGGGDVGGSGNAGDGAGSAGDGPRGGRHRPGGQPGELGDSAAQGSGEGRRPTAPPGRAGEAGAGEHRAPLPVAGGREPQVGDGPFSCECAGEGRGAIAPQRRRRADA